MEKSLVGRIMTEFRVLVCGGRDYGKRWNGTQWIEDAGPIRNKKMLTESQPHVIVACKGGSGTAHMMKIGREAGVPVLEIE